ncbi:MAG: hypothetical protein ABIJ27_02425 [Candidatus Omnitrophota bacterium]
MGRIKFISNRPLQTKILILITISIIVPLVIVGGCLYYLVFTLLAEQLGIPESIAYNLFPVINKINVMLLVGLPPMLFLLIVWGVFLSHKFVGPLERLERELELMAKKKDYAKRLKVRKGDDIEGIINGINTLLDKFHCDA